MASLKTRFQKIAEGKTTLGFDPLANDATRLAQLRVEDIDRDPRQPRKDIGDVSDLKNSIREHGLLQPIVVSPLDQSRYLLIAGERRLTATTQLGLTTIPALIRTVQDHERLELQLIENLHRKDLNPFEEAQGFKRLITEFNLTQEQVAHHVAKSVASINQALRILDLPDVIRENFQTSEKISKSVLLEIAKQPSIEQQMTLWEQAKKGELTVKLARQQKTKIRTGTAPSSSYRIRTTHATVTIHLHSGERGDASIITALREAIRSKTRQEKVSSEKTRSA
jgi:ParB family transcriptional regulator, chromosome partitioning protein